MSTIVRLAWSSLLNRRTAAWLVIASIALSVAMLLGVEKLRRDARAGFASTISGTDLIVGARTGSVQLLLSSVFRIGDATSAVSWHSYEQIANRAEVAWTVPFSLGDSHRGYRVLGTTSAYFEHYRHANRQPLRFNHGRGFAASSDVVLGAEVARRLGYGLGERIEINHGTGELDLHRHADHPFEVVGILAPTGTPVDRTLHVSLAAIDVIHEEQQAAARSGGLVLKPRKPAPADLKRTDDDPHDTHEAHDDPQTVTAFLVGLRQPGSLFAVQRAINTNRDEPLLAIIPGVALQELWDLMRIAEQALQIVSVFVVITSLLGMLTVILATLEARRREMAVLRSVGARLGHLAGLFVAEAFVLTLLGIVLGVVLLNAVVLALRPFAVAQYGIHLPVSWLTRHDLWLLSAVLVAALLISLVPAVRAFRMSLADGLSIRI